MKVHGHHPPCVVVETKDEKESVVQYKKIINTKTKKKKMSNNNNNNNNRPIIERKSSFFGAEFRYPTWGGKNPDWIERCFIFAFWSLFVLYTIIILFGDIIILPYIQNWCPIYGTIRIYPNPDSIQDMCWYYKTIYLLGLSPFECNTTRRIISSIFYGAIIGYERKQADRPAGIRTMSLVCLGSCLFTIGGQFAFRSGPQEFDAARVSAAVPSGVGFLGSAVIWKEAVNTTSNNGQKDDEKHQIHGITTAASVWLSASVGIGAGGGLYLYCTWAVVLVVFLLRQGPQFEVATTEEDTSKGGIETGSEWETDEIVSSNYELDNEKRQSREEQLLQIQRDAALIPPSNLTASARSRRKSRRKKTNNSSTPPVSFRS